MNYDQRTGHSASRIPAVADSVDVRAARLAEAARAAVDPGHFEAHVLHPGTGLRSVWGADRAGLARAGRDAYYAITIYDLLERLVLAPNQLHPELTGEYAREAAAAMARPTVTVALWRLIHGPAAWCHICRLFADDRVSALAVVRFEGDLCPAHDDLLGQPAVRA